MHVELAYDWLVMHAELDAEVACDWLLHAEFACAWLFHAEVACDWLLYAVVAVVRCPMPPQVRGGGVVLPWWALMLMLPW